MTPYYSAQNVTIYNARWQDVLPNLEPKSGVLLFGDPPYGINHIPHKGDSIARVKPATDYERVIGDDQDFDPQPLLDLNYEKYVMWGANHYASRLPNSSGWLTWIKIQGASYDCSDCELAWTNIKQPARRFIHLWRGMIKSSEKSTPRFHPNQKPCALAQWVFTAMDFHDGTVIDPFMGSGSAGVAALRAGLPYIGVEISEAYCEKAARRLEHERDNFQFDLLGALDKETVNA